VEAAALVQDGDTLLIGGSHAVPEALLVALGQRFRETGRPRGITTLHPETPGDGDQRGLSHLAQPGLIRRLIAGGYMDAPPIARMAARDELEAYMLPQGVLSQLTRDMAAGRPGLVTHVGLDTFVDPRHGGGRQSPSARDELVRLLEIDGETYLFYRSLPASVAFLRGTTADRLGNVTAEHEANLGESLSQAQATRNAGGIVVVQVERLAERVPPRAVRIPGIYVDVVVVDPAQQQTYLRRYDPAFSGEVMAPADALGGMPFGARKVIARRAAMELRAGAVCNLGVGISTGIADVAAEEGIADGIVLTNEQGLIGGLPAGGVDAGASTNFDAMIDQPSQFDFYDGGGLDQAFLSFGEVARDGSVNISRLGGRILGFGGFINISQNARSVVFSGTFTSGGLELAWPDGRTRVVSEGRHRRFVDAVEQVAYSGPRGRRHGQDVLYVTERAVFRGGEPIELVEIAPGLEPERDLFPLMGFRPAVASDVREMDARLFRPEPVGITLRPARRG
jgi:propionate CoA-transferase